MKIALSEDGPSLDDAPTSPYGPTGPIGPTCPVSGPPPQPASSPHVASKPITAIHFTVDLISCLLFFFPDGLACTIENPTVSALLLSGTLLTSGSPYPSREGDGRQKLLWWIGLADKGVSPGVEGFLLRARLATEDNHSQFRATTV